MKLTDIFNAASIAFNWNTYVADSNEPPYIGEGFFPAKKKAGLDLKFIKGSSGLPISLQESAFDAHARLRDRIGISTFQTEMPFFREGFLISEQDRQDILRAQESNDPYALQALQRIYDDSQELIRGANVVPERMRMQLLAPADGALKSTTLMLMAHGKQRIIKRLQEQLHGRIQRIQTLSQTLKICRRRSKGSQA